MSNGTQELLAALDASPGDAAQVASLERAWTEEGNYAGLAEVLPTHARALEDASLRARYLIVAASAALSLENDALHEELLVEAAGLVPDGDALGQTVVAAFEESAAWPSAISMLLSLVTRVTNENPQVRSRLLYTAGTIQEDRLFDRERAIPYYQQAFKADSSFVDPLDRARSIFRHREHWGSVAKLYQAELRVTADPARQAAILKEIGDLNLERIKDAEAALNSYRMAEQVQPDLEGLAEAIKQAEDLLQDDAEGVEVSAELLERNPAEKGGAPARAARPAARRAAGNKEEAEVPAAPVGEELPDALPAVFGEIDAASSDYIELMLDAARSASGRVATAYYARALNRMFQLDLDKEEIVDVALEAITSSNDGVVAVRDLLPALIDRRFTCEDIANALEENGADAASVYAMAFYGAADRDRADKLRDDAGDWGEIDRLALEWADKGNWRRAGQVFDQALTAAGVAEVESEGYRLQAYLCVALDQVDKAADALRRVLRRNKTERQALELSAALYGSLDRAPNQADAIRNLVGALADGDNAHKGLLLRQMAKLYKEELKQDQQVVLTLQQLVEVEPRNIAVLDELAGLLEGMARYPDLVDVLRRKAEAMDDPQEQVQLYREIANLYEERFSNQNEA